MTSTMVWRSVDQGSGSVTDGVSRSTELRAKAQAKAQAKAHAKRRAREKNTHGNVFRYPFLCCVVPCRL